MAGVTITNPRTRYRAKADSSVVSQGTRLPGMESLGEAASASTRLGSRGKWAVGRVIAACE